MRKSKQAVYCMIYFEDLGKNEKLDITRQVFIVLFHTYYPTIYLISPIKQKNLKPFSRKCTPLRRSEPKFLIIDGWLGSSCLLLINLVPRTIYILFTSISSVLRNFNAHSQTIAHKVGLNSSPLGRFKQ